jgi:hypothetical protein
MTRKETLMRNQQILFTLIVVLLVVIGFLAYDRNNVDAGEHLGTTINHTTETTPATPSTPVPDNVPNTTAPDTDDQDNTTEQTTP